MKECAKYLLKLSQGHRLGLILSVVLGVANVCLGLYFIWVSKGVVDVATSHYASAFWPMVALMAGVMVLRLALMGVRQYIIQHTNIRLVNSIRQRLFHDRHEFAVHAELDRHLRADVKVGATLVNGGLQEFVDCDVHGW